MYSLCLCLKFNYVLSDIYIYMQQAEYVIISLATPHRRGVHIHGNVFRVDRP